MRNVTPAEKHLNFCDGGSVWGLFVVDYYHCFALLVVIFLEQIDTYSPCKVMLTLS